MLKLRLKRVGRRHDPSFRIVITEATAPPKGKYLESVGFYNASLKQLKLDQERIKYWLARGAQPTGVVHNLLVREGVVKGPKIAVHSTRERKKATASSGPPPTAVVEESATEDQEIKETHEEAKEDKEEKIEKEDEKETKPEEEEKTPTDNKEKKEEVEEVKEEAEVKKDEAPTIAEGDIEVPAESVGKDKILDKEDKK